MLALAGAALLAGAPRAEAQQGSVPLTIRCIGSSQNNAPVFTGLPFPPGVLGDADQIRLFSGGQEVARQVEALSYYRDGSVRVALLGFRVTLSAGQTLTTEARYGQGGGIALSPRLSWSRNHNVLALFPPRWYGESGVFNGRFLASADNDLLPAFETRLRQQFSRVADPPTDTRPDRRSYYDHTHAVYMTLLRSGGPDSAQLRAWNELRHYRENEVLHSGTYRGQYSAGSNTNNNWPMWFNIIRRMFVEGLVEDYYFSGDPRSLEIATLMGDAYLRDAYLQIPERFTWTERTPAWEIKGLVAMYELTHDQSYLDAANYVARIMMDHQEAMAVKYPNQGGIPGQTGAFVQDRRGQWYDEFESTVSGAGSPFMTALLLDSFIRLYWHTGEERLLNSIVWAADWLANAAFAPANHPNNGSRLDTFWYICRDPREHSVTPSANPMFLHSLGFAWQATGERKYYDIARRVLAVNSWGFHIKEFNQAMRTSGQGLYFLKHPRGSVPLTLTGGAPLPPPPSPDPDPLPPATPTRLTAAGGDGRVDLAWNASDGATGYHVYRTAEGEARYTQLTGSPVGGTTYADTGVTNGTTYSYRVASVGPGGESHWSDEATATPAASATPPPPDPDPLPPPTPTGLTAAGGDGRVDLAWSASDGATGYHVYRAASGEVRYTQLTSLPVVGTAYADPAVVNGITYSYRVASVGPGGESHWSDEATATPAASATPPPPDPDPLPPPTGLTAAGLHRSVSLSWNASPGATGYHVYRSTSEHGSTTRLTTAPLARTDYADTRLRNGTTYWYRVTAVDASGNESAPSEAVSATPRPPGRGGGD